MRRNTLASARVATTTSNHRAHTPGRQTTPAPWQKPGIPAQQMQLTGTRERACGSGTGQNPLAEHAPTAPQPRSIAWEGGGEAAMKGGAPSFAESFWTRSSNGRLGTGTSVCLINARAHSGDLPTSRSLPKGATACTDEIGYVMSP